MRKNGAKVAFRSAKAAAEMLQNWPVPLATFAERKATLGGAKGKTTTGLRPSHA